MTHINDLKFDTKVLKDDILSTLQTVELFINKQGTVKSDAMALSPIARGITAESIATSKTQAYDKGHLSLN